MQQEKTFKEILPFFHELVLSGDKFITLEKGENLLKQIMAQPAILSRSLCEDDSYLPRLLITLSQMLNVQQSIYSNILLFNNFLPRNDKETNSLFHKLHGNTDFHINLQNNCFFAFLQKISDEFEYRRKQTTVENAIRYSAKTKYFSELFSNKGNNPAPTLYQLFYLHSADNEEAIITSRMERENFLSIFKGGYQALDNKGDEVYYYLAITHYITQLVHITSQITQLSGQRSLI